MTTHLALSLSENPPYDFGNTASNRHTHGMHTQNVNYHTIQADQSIKQILADEVITQSIHDLSLERFIQLKSVNTYP